MKILFINIVKNMINYIEEFILKKIKKPLNKKSILVLMKDNKQIR